MCERERSGEEGEVKNGRGPAKKNKTPDARNNFGMFFFVRGVLQQEEATAGKFRGVFFTRIQGWGWSTKPPNPVHRTRTLSHLECTTATMVGIIASGMLENGRRTPVFTAYIFRKLRMYSMLCSCIYAPTIHKTKQHAKSTRARQLNPE